MGADSKVEHDALDMLLIPYFTANAEMLLESGLTEVDCGQAIMLATLVAYEEGLGTCCIGTGEIGGTRETRMRQVFGLPDTAHLLLLMTVGYPLESREAGGQRPKLPFEQLFYINEHGQPFERDGAVVEQLKRDKMIQPKAPLAYRQAELEFVQHALGLPQSFVPMPQAPAPDPGKGGKSE